MKLDPDMSPCVPCLFLGPHPSVSIDLSGYPPPSVWLYSCTELYRGGLDSIIEINIQNGFNLRTIGLKLEVARLLLEAVCGPQQAAVIGLV